MCGIWFCLLRPELDGFARCSICTGPEIQNVPLDHTHVQEMVTMLCHHQRRGPDLSSSIVLPPLMSLPHPLSSPHFHLSGHVLWTQGSHPFHQPYQFTSTTSGISYHLLFNGDIYSFTGSESYGEDDAFNPGESNDGLNFFEALTNPNFSGDEDFAMNLVQVVSLLRGPFAFILVVSDDSKNKREVWFGRDFFGRESLTFSSDECGSFHISSVSVFNNVFEIPAAGIFKWDVAEGGGGVQLFPYFETHKRNDVAISLEQFDQYLTLLGFKGHDFNGCSYSHEIKLSFETTLLPDEDNHPILHELLILSFQKLTQAETLIKASHLLDPYITQFLDKLRTSINLRLKAIVPFCKNCVGEKRPCDHVRVGVLFSGGLDSAVLAYLVAEIVDKVDLLNVAFSRDGTNYDTVPDRETGLEAYNMLIRLSEGKQGTMIKKQINFVEINVLKEEVEIMRRERIKTLISPLKSVIDDSVGCCLWFAGRGKGTLKGEEYESPVRTVLMGSGADELLGGYSRHRFSFEKGGWPGLRNEMGYDLDRISIRNMGRDNRIVGDHGVSPRTPYLDEGLVHWITQKCPTWAKCCPPLGQRGLGEKVLLRGAAIKLWGEDQVNLALFPKRAMQFGSRIAKLENTREKGGDTCDRLG